MKSSKGIRISQIVLGGIAIALSLAVIVNPGVGIATLTFLLSITLLVVGIERLVTGITTLSKHSKSSRFGNIALGALAAYIRNCSSGISCIYNRCVSYFTSSWFAFHRNCENHSWHLR